MADAVAVYGAVVATLSLGVGGAALVWQIKASRRARETQVDTDLMIASDGRGGWWLVVEAINRSDFAVEITEAGITSERRTDGAWSTHWAKQWLKPDKATLPGTIAPNASGFTYARHELDNLSAAAPDTPQRFYAWVKTATRLEFRSEAAEEKRIPLEPARFSLLLGDFERARDY